MDRGMTCAARLKLNKPITSATTLARMTRVRIYTAPNLQEWPSWGRLVHPAQDRELFMAVINKTRRGSPQFGRASVRVTHFCRQIHFARIDCSPNLTMRKN